MTTNEEAGIADDSKLTLRLGIWSISFLVTVVSIWAYWKYCYKGKSGNS